MKHSKTVRSLSALLSVLMVLMSFQSSVLHAAMLSTDQAIVADQVEQSRTDVMQLLQEERVQQALIERGVSPEDVEQRVASLTADELNQLQAQIDELPAGAGALGLIVTIFIVLLVTDMLCATNIFSFVRCINR